MKRRLIGSLFALLLATSGVQLASAKTEPTGIAVINLKAEKGVDPSLASLMSDILRTELYNSRRFTVMNREDMDILLKEIAFQQSGACDETACIVQMGQALGVAKMVAGTIGIIGNNYVINAKLINVETFTNEILVTEYMLVKTDERPERTFRSIAWQLAGLKKLKLKNLTAGLDRKKKIGLYATFGTGFIKIETFDLKPISGVYNSVPYSITPDYKDIYVEGEYLSIGFKYFPKEWLFLDLAWTFEAMSPNFQVGVAGAEITAASFGFNTTGFDLSVNWMKPLSQPIRFIAGAGITYYRLSQVVGDEDTGPGSQIDGGAVFLRIFTKKEKETLSLARPYIRAGGEIIIKNIIGVSIFSDAYIIKYEKVESGYYLFGDQNGTEISRTELDFGKIILPKIALDFALTYYF